jgi:hypothetical protein
MGLEERKMRRRSGMKKDLSPRGRKETRQKDGW